LNKYLKKLLPLYQKMGVSIIPNRYEDPVPDLEKLKNYDWAKESKLVGMDLREKEQAKLLGKFSKKYLKEFKQFPLLKTAPPEVEQYHVYNPAFGAVDAAIYYCMVRHWKPRKIIEIGAGFSTLLSAQAAVRNKKDGYPCELTAIEPYPSKTLRDGVPGLTRLWEKNLQDVPMREFEKLGKNDILFIDSSHVLKTGSDVQLEFLEILPRLKPGVLVHVHDIFFPLDYPRSLVMKDFKFYTEQYLLQAFLTFNTRVEVLWAGYLFYLKQRNLLKKYFGEYFKDSYNPERFWRSVSFWIRRK
jgi:predicted O-methyltransferase YrrM